ncbi:AraC family transcriptional regulator [Azoarcus olearius]|uniref:AraC-family transcriptional regulator n=1 Tax=Azoarcus sp. (strain BH72) TaxID=418699 RepID=A1K6X7_AZOSB|nr:AraC family transcriptional regulator [Azoarcus olearius]ANQ85157.1 AraC family transcriptional regulator [Azoarcus olearius]CAL94582.1 putative AraC-family transcriptional regulator [Azoarcus olearius]
MDLHGWDVGRTDHAAMASFERFHTRDIEEARRWGTRVFCENQLRSLDARKPVDARMYYRKLKGIGIGRMSYGGEVTIDPGQLDTFYLVQMPLCGGERVESAGAVTMSSPNTGTVLNAHCPIRIRHGERTEKLIVRVDRDLLERQCSQHLGRTLQRHITFDTAMPLDTGGGIRWMRTIAWLLENLRDEDGPASPLLSAQIEQMLVTMLLVCQPNNYSGALHEDVRTVTPAFVRRAEHYIDEHAHEAITVCDIAEHVGVSSRSLYTGFRKYRNTSPMLYLKETRLNRVREQLLSTEPGRTTVTAVAYQWGFGHLGHFTTDYKRRFGESPSETLAR